MAIRFKCEHCSKVLSTPDNTGGKKGKCPHCGSLMAIPVSSTYTPAKPSEKPAGAGDFFADLPSGNAGASPTSPLGSSGLTPLGPPQDDLLSELTDNDSLGLEPVGNPLGAPSSNPLGGQPANPFAGSSPSASSNPYASPQGFTPNFGGGVSREQAKGKVAIPAYGMMVYAGFALFLVLLNLGATFLMGFDNAALDPFGNGEPAGEAEQIGRVIGVIVGAVIGIGLFTLVAIGAYKMLKLESYGMAMAASIISLLPCSICCPLGMIFGIWGLIALNSQGVKQAFG